MLALANTAHAFEPLSNDPWLGKAQIMRTTCEAPRPVIEGADPRIVIANQAENGALRITALTGRTPAILDQALRAQRFGRGFQLTAANGQALTLSRTGLSLARWDQRCDQVFRFDQSPMPHPARRAHIVGRSGHPAYPSASLHADFQAALTAAQPGDLILLSDGPYQGPLRIPADRGGAPGSWLTIASLTPFGAEVTADTQEAAIAINGARHVEIRGLRVTNRGIGDCIGARAAAHIRIISNVVRDCGGGGIAAMQSDFIRMEGNIALRNAFISPWQNSGLSIYQPQTVDGGAGWRGVIANNISALNDNLAPAPGQRFATDGNGIIIDDGRNTQNGSRAGPYPYPILVENNLVFGNGGSGVRVFESDRVTVRRTTSYWNDNTKSPRQQERSELAAMTCGGCRFERNIAVAGPFPGDPVAAFVYGDTPGNVWRDNILAEAGQPRAKTRVIDSPAAPDFSQNQLDLPPAFRRALLSLQADFTVTGPQQLLNAGYGADMRLLPPLAIAQ